MKHAYSLKHYLEPLRQSFVEIVSPFPLVICRIKVTIVHHSVSFDHLMRLQIEKLILAQFSVGGSVKV